MESNLESLLQVSSATATFAMTFSSSMSVVEYYLLNRFPVPYGRYHNLPFYYSSNSGFSACYLPASSHALMHPKFFIAGGVGILNMIEKIEDNDYMGVENLCRYQA
ncbi:hypothetical protein BHE74_00029872 [Ensete ventricosum]|uniref:Uncharacterized protein n=1 Tax=Ensete ventricosum TaxID=4639 RepID=A0A427A6J8_ENSVE|nr:hypothetical protein B296_00034726 [Ensete ventricosum]RWW33483.1 hypothetical protein GW17_00001800 [Ensete ventricosum]RWW62979.1 hypothetical protein BHE74_00029872 [Ensete ventricosum]RZS15442.1 hypothetical protein BHM03_00047288 [Ensete ventricosum]